MFDIHYSRQVIWIKIILHENGYVFEDYEDEEDYILDVKHTEQRTSEYSSIRVSVDEFEHYQDETIEEVKSKENVEVDSRE